ncbi:MAG: Na+/H+ antiporter NhaC family protein [Eubacteriales bacterium]|nr:Na+/H+ antiporter NhaC family protein [Eubacteriales bacterium]
MKQGKAIALLPIGIFVVLYLGMGILFEYVLRIPMGFYSIPIVVVFLVALLAACLQNRSLSFDEKLTLMGRGIGDKNIVTMILIFLEAGIFVGVVGRSSAESVAYFMLSLIPARYAVAVLFVVSCFVSTAMGTSVGTITLITPIAVPIAAASGFSLPLCIGTVVGGAMFGDNLSFISDTTIAACNGQGCEMKDKFRENFAIALPAALATLVLIVVLSLRADIVPSELPTYNLVQIVPYVLVLIGGVIGINVFVVLLVGIVSGSVIMLCTGAVKATELLANMGSGAAGMFETAMVAILVSAICALIREYGGFDALLSRIQRVFKGRRGGQLGIGLLVGAMDIATANNTVAIVMANPIAAEMAASYGISGKKTASLLDTFSCVFQGIIPYGAQMLVAISAAASLGYEISAFEIIPNLFYPFLLLLSSLVFIFLIPEKKYA